MEGGRKWFWFVSRERSTLQLSLAVTVVMQISTSSSPRIYNPCFVHVFVFLSLPLILSVCLGIHCVIGGPTRNSSDDTMGTECLIEYVYSMWGEEYFPGSLYSNFMMLITNLERWFMIFQMKVTRPTVYASPYRLILYSLKDFRLLDIMDYPL